MIQVKVGDKLNRIGTGALSTDNPYTVLYADDNGALLRDRDDFTVWESLSNIETDYVFNYIV